jgi:hypothetical protein
MSQTEIIENDSELEEDGITILQFENGATSTLSIDKPGVKPFAEKDKRFNLDPRITGNGGILVGGQTDDGRELATVIRPNYAVDMFNDPNQGPQVVRVYERDDNGLDFAGEWGDSLTIGERVDDEPALWGGETATLSGVMAEYKGVGSGSIPGAEKTHNDELSPFTVADIAIDTYKASSAAQRVVSQ